MIILEEVELGLERNIFQLTLEGMIEAAVDQDQVQEQVPIRDSFRCFKCREYDQFAKDCLTYIRNRKRAVRVETAGTSLRGGQDNALKVLVADTYENLIRANSEETNISF